MSVTTDDLRIQETQELISPEELIADLPVSETVSNTVSVARRSIHEILTGEDDRLLVVVGPCSIHDEKAALEYAGRLKALADRISDRVFVVMRVYFEKPRTTVGWKGLINDPNLDGTLDVGSGMRRARKLLVQIGEIGLPAGTEFLDPITPQYLADLTSWGAIGARTTESQTHRQMASGLSMPVGFKNGTDGGAQVAVDAIVSALAPHAFLGIDRDGRTAVIHTTGNAYGHMVLRGGSNGPNFDAASLSQVRERMESGGIGSRLIVDCSHANSAKDHARQSIAFRDVLAQRAAGDSDIVGCMLESHLSPGNQKLGADPSTLEYGVSITDACIGWDETDALLVEAYEALATRAGAAAGGGD